MSDETILSYGKFSKKLHQIFCNCTKEKVQHMLTRFLDILEDSSSYDYFIAHNFGSICPDELSHANTKQKLANAFALESKLRRVNVNIDAKDSTHFTCAIEEGEQYHEDIGYIR